MTYAHVGELSVWYERRGEGPRVLFISGSGGDLRVKPNVFDGRYLRTAKLRRRSALVPGDDDS